MDLGIALYADSMTQSLFEVWRTSFWMMHYGAESAKRTAIWSNSKSLIQYLVGGLALMRKSSNYKIYRRYKILHPGARIVESFPRVKRIPKPKSRPLVGAQARRNGN